MAQDDFYKLNQILKSYDLLQRCPDLIDDSWKYPILQVGKLNEQINLYKYRGCKKDPAFKNLIEELDKAIAVVNQLELIRRLSK